MLMCILSFSACASCTTENHEQLTDGVKEEIPNEEQPKEETENKDKDMDYSKFPLSDGQNGQAPTIRLNSGYDMPIIGLGTYSLTGDVCVKSVKSAIKAGFRKIDTAHMYGNEV